MAAVTKKFRWTNADGETMEVEIGADGGNVTVDGKPLTDVLDEIVSKAGNVIAESGEITSASSEITLSTVPAEGTYYFIPPQYGCSWDTISWGNKGADEWGSWTENVMVAQGEASIIKYTGGTGSGSFELVARFPGPEKTEQWDTAAEKLSALEEAIESSKKYSSTPQEIGTWIDETPVWRFAFDRELEEIEKTDGYVSFQSIVGDVVKNMNYAFVIHAFASTRLGADPCVIDDYSTKIDGNAFNIEGGSGQTGIYGYMDIVTPSSNIKTT